MSDFSYEEFLQEFLHAYRQLGFEQRASVDKVLELAEELREVCIELGPRFYLGMNVELRDFLDRAMLLRLARIKRHERAPSGV